MEYIAKSNGITLREHSIAVFNKVNEIISNSNITDKRVILLSQIASIVHDCGKTMSSFQKHMRGEIIDEEGSVSNPRHNIVGGSLLNLLLDDDKLYETIDKTIIRYVTLYHHTLINNDNNSLPYRSEELNYISEYYNNIFKECGLDSIIQFKYNIDSAILEETQIVTPKFFDFISSDETSNLIKINQLKIFEIVFNIVRYADYVVSSGIDIQMNRFNNHLSSNDFVMPFYFDSNRWDEQCNAADEAYCNNMSIISATMGWGKTVCGINYFLHSNKRGFWVCPDNGLATATYNSIVSTINECGVGNIRVALLLSGSWICNNFNGTNITLNDIDIIVTNIDSYINGVFRNSRKELSYDSLFSNCIFDEFHEYAFMNAPILARFKTVVEARKLMDNVKTLFLSGTNINNGYLNIDNNNVIHKGLNLEQDKKIKLYFITKQEYENEYISCPDSVVINTRIKSCQSIYEDGNFDFCYHSEFDDNDSNIIVQNIMQHNGKNAKESKSKVSSTSVFSRGIDVSFSNCFIINPTPLMIEQITGRSNRWNRDKECGNIYIVIDNDKNELAIYKKPIAKEDMWNKYYLPYIEYLKTNIVNGSEISIYQLKEHRINFFENETTKLLNKLIRNNLTESINQLKLIEFTKGSSIGDKINDIKHSSDKIDVRGESLTRFFRIQMDNSDFGVLSGPINIPFYRFGEHDSKNGFSKLKDNPYIISNIKRYFELNQEEALKYDIKNIKKWKDNNLFNRLIEKSKSSETPFPILCDYGYNNEIGFYKKN